MRTPYAIYVKTGFCLALYKQPFKKKKYCNLI
jgi:hypothetical protein